MIQVKRPVYSGLQAALFSGAFQIQEQPLAAKDDVDTYFSNCR